MEDLGIVLAGPVITRMQMVPRSSGAQAINTSYGNVARRTEIEVFLAGMTEGPRHRHYHIKP